MDLSKLKVIIRETFGAFSRDFLMMAVLLQKLNLTRPSPNSLVSLPSGAKKKKCCQGTKVSRNTVYLASCPVWRNLLTLLWFYFWIPSAIKLWPKPTLWSGIFLVQDLSYHLPILCSSIVFPHSALYLQWFFFWGGNTNCLGISRVKNQISRSKGKKKMVAPKG